MESNFTINDTSYINCESYTDISESKWLFYYVYVWWVEGIGSIFTGIIGIFFNSFELFVFYRERHHMINSVNVMIWSEPL